MLTSDLEFSMIELIGYRGNPFKAKLHEKIKYPLVSFHFSFVRSINVVKYSNTSILCVIPIIYKKLSFWTSPKFCSDWSKIYFKSFLKISYCGGKVLEFPGYNRT